jgi:hypothetical protein
MTPHEDVVARILALAEESPSKTISGGRLSELVKHHLPGFTTTQYGARNMRAFVRSHLFGKLNEVGRVGMDIVSGLPGAPVPVPIPASAQPQPPSRYTLPGNISHDAFRVFKSPNSPLELQANRDTGAIRIVDVGLTSKIRGLESSPLPRGHPLADCERFRGTGARRFSACVSNNRP